MRVRKAGRQGASKRHIRGEVSTGAAPMGRGTTFPVCAMVQGGRGTREVKKGANATKKRRETQKWPC